MPDLKPIRDGFGEGLLELGASNPRVVALSGDLEDSTRAIWFKQKYPNRFISVGIAEQDMVAMAAGLALAGKIPFACSFSTFLTGKAWEQIRLAVCYQQANVKLIGSHGGLSVGADGATAESLEEFTTLRALPHLTVLAPCDAIEAKKATLAAAAHVGPVFLRLGRNPMPLLTQADTPFTIGRAHVLHDGEDVALIATGIMVNYALQAAALLQAQHVSARVINCPTVKPLDRATILAAARETGALVTAEEHTVLGGLGGAVAELVVQEHPVPMRLVGIQDRFGTSGSPDELLRAFGLTPEAITAAALDVVKHKTHARPQPTLRR